MIPDPNDEILATKRRLAADRELGSDPLPNERTRYFPLLSQQQQHRLLETLQQLPLEQNAFRDSGHLI